MSPGPAPPCSHRSGFPHGAAPHASLAGSASSRRLLAARIPCEREPMSACPAWRGPVSALGTVFRETGSAYGVVQHFAKNGLRLPKRAYGGAWDGKLIWGRLSHGRVIGLLKNPSYAGVQPCRPHHSVGCRDRKASRQVHRNQCCRVQARRCPVCTLARRHPVRSEPRDRGESSCCVVSRQLADQALPVLRNGQRPNNGCPKAVSASPPLQASAPRRPPRFRDCTPPTDFHLCVITIADNRF